jgi:hypothetical protein
MKSVVLVAECGSFAANVGYCAGQLGVRHRSGWYLTLVGDGDTLGSTKDGTEEGW